MASFLLVLMGRMILTKLTVSDETREWFCKMATCFSLERKTELPSIQTGLFELLEDQGPL